MGKAKKTRKFAQAKKLISPHDPRLAHGRSGKEAAHAALVSGDGKAKAAARAKANGNGAEDSDGKRAIPQMATSLFFKYNASLHPPYRVLIDTNFVNFCIKNKLDVVRGLMDCTLAKCIPCVTDCVLAELEKLGEKFRLALRLAKDDRFERLTCTHEGTYADDCLVDRVLQNRCYLVATNDAQLKQRLRKVPGVPILYVGNHVIKCERLPDLLM